MYALIAVLPILLTVVFMVVLGWPAKRALPVSWGVACLVAGGVWKRWGWWFRVRKCSARSMLGGADGRLSELSLKGQRPSLFHAVEKAAGVWILPVLSEGSACD